ncbi:hypothetical protein KQ944_08445 [Bacillus subtilis]|uniref:hypothetical protein n=1 Tax=Pseudochrobactrum asaccharolyticum TaxID=354351 RepID=UPI001F16374A|nr:hypothetical protein [Pseudochrobactrum asaccharolyticum]MCF7671652.1 hypothetical protein [Bacillus subtilis]
MRLTALFTTSALSSLAMLCTAMAADVTQPSYKVDSEWKIIVSPYVWGASLKGKAAMGGHRTDVNIPFSEIFDNLDLAAMGTIEIIKGPLGFFVDGQYVSTTQDEDILANELALNIKTTTISGGAFYRVYERELGGVTVFNEAQTFTVEPMLGVRWTKIKADLSVGPFSISKKAEWTDPFVGVRLKTDLNERWNLAGEADIGGFGAGSKLSYNAQAYLGYRTFLFDRPTNLRIGYRVLSQDFKGPDFLGHSFKWDVVQHGPVVGLSMRF